MILRSRAPAPRGRAGITLIEILISILIMGVGVMCVATLFPIGLARLHNAAKWSRSTYLGESAASDINARKLFNKNSFLNPAVVGTWYVGTTPNGPARYDPWIQDTDTAGSWKLGAYRGFGGDGKTITQLNTPPPAPFRPGTGLPVAYDPLWRALAISPTTNATNPPGLYPGDPATEARFASGFGFLRNDPNGGAASAHGLQRITNFNPTKMPLHVLNQVPQIFVSPEDIVLQDGEKATAYFLNPVPIVLSSPSPIVPDIIPDPTPGPRTGQPLINNDWRYTWMFTGYQTDAINETVFDGEIVVFENRPFGVDQLSAGQYVATGERVVEAIFGYSLSVSNGVGSLAAGYGIGADRTVVLRWPAALPDPEVKVGSWIADVTYERTSALDDSRRLDSIKANAIDNGQVVIYPYQRCWWYQVAQKSTVAADTLGDVANYRAMTLTTVAPLRAKTLLNRPSPPSPTSGTPYHVNAALVCPHVVNVISRTLYNR